MGVNCVGYIPGEVDATDDDVLVLELLENRRPTPPIETTVGRMDSEYCQRSKTCWRVRCCGGRRERSMAWRGGEIVVVVEGDVMEEGEERDPASSSGSRIESGETEMQGM